VGFDSSRFTFDPWRDFLGVVMQQGRPQLDSDWNEWLAELARRIQGGTLDTLGRAGYPAAQPYAFLIKTSQDAQKNNHITIGAGRMYVDGLIAENHGVLTSAKWDPALAEWSCAPAISNPQENPQQNPPEVDVDYTLQPHLPNATISGNGPFLVYLDVWLRAVTFLECPDLVEKALAVDTTGRLQTIWQVKLLDISNVSGTVTCSTPDASIPVWNSLITPTGARLSTNHVPTPSTNVCCLAPNTGYTGLENQLYRVQIHQSGVPVSNTSGPVTLPVAEPGTATFKWSRNNASVATSVTAIGPPITVNSTASSPLTVASTGKDSVLRFSANDWVEITDDWLELNGSPGDLHVVTDVNDAAQTITVVPPVASGKFDPTNASRHTRLIRWDQPYKPNGQVLQSDNKTVWVDLGASGSTGDIPVPPPNTALILEDGITVQFNLDPNGSQSFQSGDFWCFAARATDGTVETLTQAAPLGIHHHYARLAIVTFGSAPTDCRQMFPPLTRLTQLHYVGGDGQQAAPGALLPEPLQAGVANGSFPVAGALVQFKVLSGSGTLHSGSSAGATVTVPTGPDGVASCSLQLGSVTANQRVEATLVSGDALPVYYNASFTGLMPDTGIHIIGVYAVSTGQTSPTPLLNDSSVTLDGISGGIQINCDQAIDPASVGRPTCFVSIEVPYLINSSLRGDVAPSFTALPVAYQTLILDAQVEVSPTNGTIITWQPSLFTKIVLQKVGPMEIGTRGILARLTLLGNFIWSSANHSVYLDGDSFGMPGTAPNTGSTVLSLPSGDQRRGGTFTMWFWLALVRSVSITDAGPWVTGKVIKAAVEVTSPPPPGSAGYPITLSASAVQGYTIQFSPSPVTIPPGKPTAAFTVEVSPTTPPNPNAIPPPFNVSITASLGTDAQSTNLAISKPT
jgi:Family of unknown function (DUF6519)